MRRVISGSIVNIVVFAFRVMASNSTRFLESLATNTNSIGVKEPLNEKLLNTVINALERDAGTSIPLTMKAALSRLPTPILLQFDPLQPRSLIGCSYKTVPFDLWSCTEGLVRVAPLKGSCTAPDAYFDEERMECRTRSEAQPYILCPEGYRVTLPPHDILKGPCQHSDAVPGIPICDPPYELSLEHGYCYLRRAQLGFIGCRPGEKRKGSKCLVAFQRSRIIHCPEGFTGKFTNLGAECAKDVEHPGSWNVYTQTAVCPGLSRPRVDRSLKKQSFGFPRRATSNVHDPISVVPRNVSCIETVTAAPLNVTCPSQSIGYQDYITLLENDPPVQAVPTFPRIEDTCVTVDTYNLAPVCPSIEQQIYLDDIDAVLAQLRERLMKENKNGKGGERSVELKPTGIRSLKQAPSPIEFTGYRRQLLRRRVSHPTSRWEVSNLENVIQLEPPTYILEPAKNESIQVNGNVLPPTSRVYPTLQRKPASSFLTHELSTTEQQKNTAQLAFYKHKTPFLPQQPDDVPLIVNWDTLRSMEDFAEALAPFGLTPNDVDWKTLDVDRGIRVVCETLTTAEFYLACPENFRLRKDGNCIGTGHTNFLMLCPSDFKLDRVDLIPQPVRRPTPRCVGYVPSATNYYCAWSSSDESTLMRREEKNTTFSKTSIPSSSMQFKQRSNDSEYPQTVARGPSVSGSSSMTLNSETGPISGSVGVSDDLSHLRTLYGSTVDANISSFSHFSSNIRGTPKRELYEAFHDIENQLCYEVVRRRKAWFSPTMEILIALYGTTQATQFIEYMTRAERLGGSPFFNTLPNVVPTDTGFNKSGR